MVEIRRVNYRDGSCVGFWRGCAEADLWVCSASGRGSEDGEMKGE